MEVEYQNFDAMNDNTDGVNCVFMLRTGGWRIWTCDGPTGATYACETRESRFVELISVSLAWHERLFLDELFT